MEAYEGERPEGERDDGVEEVELVGRMGVGGRAGKGGRVRVRNVLGVGWMKRERRVGRVRA